MSIHFLPSANRRAFPTSLGLAEVGWHARAALRALMGGVREAARRYRTRRHLATLQGHLLRDIGVSPMDAAMEAAKPFWRG